MVEQVKTKKGETEKGGDIFDSIVSLKDIAKFNVVVQIFGLLGTSIIMDGGFTFNIFLTSCLAYWLGFGMIGLRRRANPTKYDIIFLKSGLFILLGPTSLAAFLIVFIVSH